MLLLPQLGWATDFRVSAGSESFVWQEYDTSGNTLLEESGLRHFISFDADSWVDSQWQSDFGGRVYSSTVDYDGQTQSGTPVSSNTDYDGLQLEAGFSYYPGRRHASAGAQGRSGIRMSVGADYWRRNIQDSQLPNGTPVNGYVERYTTTYGRIAIHYGGGGPWSFNVGVKYPFAVTETVGLKALGLPSDGTLHPQGRFSLYADLALQLSRAWGAQVYYDGYRFAKSDPETVGTTIIEQPEIHEEVFGAKLRFTF